MIKHTQEPWFLDKYKNIIVGEEKLLLGGIRTPMTSGRHMDEAEANARRIVACVNACEGMSNEELEGGVLLGAMEKRIETLEQRRDELLAALEDIMALDWRSRLRGLDRPTDFAEREAAVSTVGEAGAIARQAIAKAKGGAS